MNKETRPMKIKNRIKTFIRKISCSNSLFEIIEHEASLYHAMMSCVKVECETDYTEGKSRNGIVYFRCPTSETYTISLNVKDMLKAGEMVFNESVKWGVEFK